MTSVQRALPRVSDCSFRGVVALEKMVAVQNASPQNLAAWRALPARLDGFGVPLWLQRMRSDAAKIRERSDQPRMAYQIMLDVREVNAGRRVFTSAFMWGGLNSTSEDDLLRSLIQNMRLRDYVGWFVALDGELNDLVSQVQAWPGEDGWLARATGMTSQEYAAAVSTGSLDLLALEMLLMLQGAAVPVSAG